MLLRKYLTTISVVPYTIFALAFSSLPYMATAGQSDNDAHAHQHHQHHKIPMDVERTEASYTVPEVTLTNQDGERVSLPGLLKTDQPVLLNFIFTSCTAICPAMSATFSSVQNKLGNDSSKLRMISVSIDPEYDTPDALNAYADRFQAGPQWEFLTGSLEESVTVQKAFDADRGDKMNHAPMTLLRATPDSEWIRFDGFTTADELAQTVRTMLRKPGRKVL